MFNTRGVFTKENDIHKFFDFEKNPVLHTRCKLLEVRPLQQVFSFKAINFMKSMIWKKEVQVAVDGIEPHSSISLVRVAYPIHGVSYVSGASLARGLISLGLARPGRPALKDGFRMSLLSSKEALFKKCTLPTHRIFSAVVSHTESPDLFYVNPAAKEAELLQMQRDIQRFYTSPEAENLKVFNVWKDMPVVAPFQTDGCFYRAVVDEISTDPRMIDIVVVKFIDYGNRETVLKNQLYYVAEQFMQQEEMAIPACLGDVEPVNTKVWSTNATNLFKELQDTDINEAKIMAVTVLDKKIDAGTGNINRISVILSKWTRSSPKSMSISDEMVERKFAKKKRTERGGDSTSGSCDSIWEEFRNEDFDCYNILYGIHLRNTRAEFLPKDCLVPCRVLNVETPLSFYVHLRDKSVREYYSEMSSRLDLMMRETSVKANRRFQTGETNVFNLGDPVSICFSDCWLRGEVRKIIPSEVFASQSNSGVVSMEVSASTSETPIDPTPLTREVTPDPKSFKYEVFCIDGGYTFTFPAIQVFRLPQEFTLDSPFAIHCALAGVVPAGGSSWSQAAIDEFNKFVSGSNSENLHLFLKAGVPQKREVQPLLCNLIAIKSEITGPFTPPKKTFLCLTDLMTGEMGVALEERRPRGESGPKVSDTELLNDLSVRQRTRGVKIEVAGDSSDGTKNLFVRILIARNEALEQNNTMTDDLCMYEPAHDPPFSFKGLVTWVDHDGNIFCQMSAGTRLPIEDVNQAILETMKEGELPHIGINGLYSYRACIAKYQGDQTWNRAKILGQSKTKSSHVKINFVDFGQNEEVLLEDIRGVAIRKDIPELAIKMRMFESKIIQEKIDDFRDEFRKICIDKTCHFVWENAYKKDPMKVSIQAPKLPEDPDEVSDLTDVKKWLSNKDLIEEVCDFEEVPLQVTGIRGLMDSSPYDNNSFEEEDGFKPFQFYHLTGGVTAGKSFVFLQKRGVDMPSNAIERNIRDQQDVFLRMLEELQDIGPSAPTIGTQETCKQGTVCIALWRQFDGVYYRAVVTSALLEGSKREVLFIDYGNLETVPASDIKEIPQRFVRSPEIHCFLARIDNIRPAKGVDWEEKKIEGKIQVELSRCCQTMIGYFYTKKLRDRTETLVDLYEADSKSSLRPAKHLLQGLVDNGFLEFVEEPKKFLVIKTKKPPKPS